MIVLDTNIVAYFFRGEGQVANNLFAMRPSEIALPAVVVYELRYGFTRLSQPSKHLPKLVELLRWITVLPFETKTAEIAARIRVETESRGKRHRAAGYANRSDRSAAFIDLGDPQRPRIQRHSRSAARQLVR
jgi:predicted nucleic acid-binding protein